MTIDVQVTANTNPAIQALDRLGTKIESIQGKFSDSFSKMNIAATALGGTLIALGATVARFADEITDIADANGLATAEVLAFQTALQASGGKADNVGQALQRLSNAVDDANNGNMKAVGSFAKLGVSMTDLGNLSQSEIREKLLTSLSNIPDAMQRNALATEFFGKALIGVDLTKLIAQEQAARVEAEKYAPALETAGAAFDKILSITNQIKMAFAQAFEPLFRIIKDLNIQTDTLVTSFRLLGAALVTITAASTANAILKLSTAFGVLNSVVAKNPLIRLGIALASAAAGVAAYVGLTGDAAEATKDLNKEIEKPKTVADQSGYLDVLAKQRTAISKSTGELERGFKIAQDKYNIDLAGLSLTEDQKNAEAAKAKIQQDADKAKADAQAAFDALDKTSQATQRTFLAETLKGIDDRAVKEKAASDERLTNFARERDLLKQLQSIVSLDAGQRKSMFDAQMKFENSRIMGINEEIAAEEQLKSIGNLRAELLSRTTKLADADKAAAVNAISSVLDSAENLKNGVMDYGSSLKQAFSQFKLSPEAEKILTAEPFKQIIDNGKTAIAINQFLSDQSRTFAYGWEQAFKTYVREADNAATQAQQLFGTLTKGIEDAFVTLAQTGKTSFKGLLSDITAQLLRSQIRQLLSNLFTPNQNGGGLLGSIFTAGKKLLGFANGGIIPTNGPVIVGERGPELLSGAAGRTVTPNNQLGSTSVTYNINAVDAMSFKQMLAQDPTFLHAVAEQGRRTLPGAR
jgi:hypothetical protein